MKYELSEQVVNNLIAFLNRTDLKGSEVGAFLDIINALKMPIVENVEDK